MQEMRDERVVTMAIPMVDLFLFLLELYKRALRLFA